MISVAYGYNWDLWNLFHKVTFDGSNRIIMVNEGVTELNIKEDVYSNWKEWASLIDNSYWPDACRSIGGDPTVNNQRAGDIYFLKNNWKLYIDVTKVKITGALFSDNFDTAYHDLNGVPVFAAEVSSLVTTQEVGSSVGIEAKILELWRLAGLDSANVTSITDTSITVGGVTITIGQPDSGTTTLTRG